jgi:hypothetical protein
MGIGGRMLIGVVGATVSEMFAVCLGTFFLDVLRAKGSGEYRLARIDRALRPSRRGWGWLPLLVDLFTSWVGSRGAGPKSALPRPIEESGGGGVRDLWWR